MTTVNFALQPHLDKLYKHSPRNLALTATTADEFADWKRTLRNELVELLGIARRELPPKIQAEKLQMIDRGDYVEEKYALNVSEGVYAPIYILVPKIPPPYKPIMVFHGHNPSVQYVLGQYPDEATARARLAVDNNYAQALAQAGYLVCAVEQRGFGERVSAQVGGPEPATSCRHLSFDYLMQGRTLMGERVWDGVVAISYVESRADVIPRIMGCTGNSGGGTTTCWLAALDDRITVAVPSCCFCSFKESILGVYHCECNYVPNLLNIIEMGELAALLAPRPLRIINGEHDPIFPIAAAYEEFETVKRAYQIFDVEDRCSLAVHPGGHAYNHALSHAWFKDWL